MITYINWDSHMFTTPCPYPVEKIWTKELGVVYTMHATIIDDLNGKNHATTDDIQNILNNFTYRILNPTLSLIMYTRVQYYLTSLHSLQV